MGSLNPEFMREFRAAKPSVPAVLAWVEALRSDTYQQQRGAIFGIERNTACCLGVAVTHFEHTEIDTTDEAGDYLIKDLGFAFEPKILGNYGFWWSPFAEANDVDNWTFDQIADWLETAINLQRTIDLLSALPDERFNISSLRTNSVSDEELQHNCGTAACIAGWASLFRPDARNPYSRARDALGLDAQQAEYLFLPIGWDRQAWTREQAIATLIRFRDTGEISWQS
jgi:hypothetical protein